jgi:hypothetical protein
MEQNNRLFMPFSIVQSNPVVPKSKEQIFLFRNSQVVEVLGENKTKFLLLMEKLFTSS